MLRALEIAVTSKCNLKCLHCYQGDDKKIKYTLSYDVILSIFSDAKELGAKTVILTGGEFFLHPQWDKIIKAAYSKNFNISIVTNATLLDDDKINYLESFKEKIRLAISIDGFQEDHDFRRGKGSFEATIRNANKLSQKGISLTAQITLDKRNIKYLDKLVEYLIHIGFKKFTFINIGLAGYAIFHKNDLFDNKREFSETIRKLYLYTTVNKLEERLKNGGTCNIFPKGMSINYDGTVYPCTFARDLNILPLGNVYTESIKYIYEKQSKEFSRIWNWSVFDLKNCLDCLHFKNCGGGCRIRAFKFFKEVTAPDPFGCYVFKGEFKDCDPNGLMWGDNIPLK